MEKITNLYFAHSLFEDQNLLFMILLIKQFLALEGNHCKII